MRRASRLALCIGVPVTLAVTFFAGWIAVTGTYDPPVWTVCLAALTAGVLCRALEAGAEAVQRRRLRRTRPLRRQHARPLTRKAAR
ncbi:hypothetical protein P1P75_33480 [Streptomyces sp. ID05-39B]|uniref:hypothetical protein n=1 Tax=Streptomyces sp. ID05-39B TaxID=3028664 RepID=UPI0029BD2885|nr:hypothetical protein [Streptomyces sp. ID05-39B]MDX3531186.1 hypothetical protein [Streptomyces sp. ID05-39B]